MHSKSDNIEIMINDVTHEIIEKLFDSFNSLNSEFAFDYVQLLYYQCYKIDLNHGGSHIDSPDWIKNNKSHQ